MTIGDSMCLPMIICIYEKLITAYNIFGLLFCRCNVDRLKMLRKPLPLPEPFEDVWSKVTKIIGM